MSSRNYTDPTVYTVKNRKSDTCLCFRVRLHAASSGSSDREDDEPRSLQRSERTTTQRRQPRERVRVKAGHGDPVTAGEPPEAEMRVGDEFVLYSMSRQQIGAERVTRVTEKVQN